MEALGSHNRQRHLNVLEGNWNVAEAKWKLLGVAIGQMALMLLKVTRTLQSSNGSFWIARLMVCFIASVFHMQLFNHLMIYCSQIH